MKDKPRAKKTDKMTSEERKRQYEVVSGKKEVFFKKVEVDQGLVRIELSNGVVMDISGGDLSQYIHVSFCRIELPLIVSYSHFVDGIQKLRTSNVFDISYKLAGT